MTPQQLLEFDCEVNGSRQRIACAADRRLIDILRDDLRFVACKKACGVGRCGACLVLMNGAPVNACLVMAWQLPSADIVTPEGLDALPEACAVREALTAENAFQCGYCAPGFSVALTALFLENSNPTEQEVRAALEGNICRCTGYQSILRGALKASKLFTAGNRAAAQSRL